MVRPGAGTAIRGFSLRWTRDPADEYDVCGRERRRKRRPGFRKDNHAARKERTAGALCTDGHAGRRCLRRISVHHGAMVLAAAAAAGRQIRFGVDKQRGANQREAE